MYFIRKVSLTKNLNLDINATGIDKWNRLTTCYTLYQCNCKFPNSLFVGPVIPVEMHRISGAGPESMCYFKIIHDTKMTQR